MVAYKDKASPANAFFQWPFLVENRYLFTNLKECSMRYRVLSYLPRYRAGAEGCTVDSGRVNLPALEPGETGYACIAAWENPEIREKFFSKGDVLELEAIGLDGKSVCTRTYPISFAKSYFEGQLASLKRTGKGCCVNEADSLITLCSDWVDISFRRKRCYHIFCIAEERQPDNSVEKRSAACRNANETGVSFRSYGAER